MAQAKLAAPLKAILEQCVIDMTPDEVEEEAEDAEELCNCKFTLAYGTKVNPPPLRGGKRVSSVGHRSGCFLG